MSARRKPRIGQRFGRLVVVAHAHVRRDSGDDVWRLRCSCGIEIKRTTAALLTRDVNCCDLCLFNSTGKKPRERRLDEVAVRESSAAVKMTDPFPFDAAPCARCGLRGPHTCLTGDATKGMGEWQ